MPTLSLDQWLKKLEHQHPVEIDLGLDRIRKVADRLGIVPVIINNDGEVEQIPFHGSAHINSLVHANSLMEIPKDILEIKKGDFVYVRPL